MASATRDPVMNEAFVEKDDGERETMFVTNNTDGSTRTFAELNLARKTALAP